jgi:hypothetical protein
VNVIVRRKDAHGIGYPLVPSILTGDCGQDKLVATVRQFQQEPILCLRY